MKSRIKSANYKILPIKNFDGAKLHVKDQNKRS